MRDAYVMYRSFWEAIKDLPDKDIAQAIKAISEYALDDIEPQTDGIVATIFRLIKPQIDANNRKYENGCKGAKYGALGGRPKKSKNPKETPKEKEKENVKDKVKDKVSKTEIETFFEKIWALYPIKKGKASISDSKKKVLFKVGFEPLEKCIQRYCKEMEDVDKKFWKYGSTFFNSGYVDYLDSNYSTANDDEKSQDKYSENHTEEDDDSEGMDYWGKDEVNEDV